MRLLLGGFVAVLALPVPALARDPEAERAYDQVRFVLAPVVFSGSWIEGVGSRQRYSGAAVDLQLSVTRSFSRWFGLMVSIGGLPPIPMEARDAAYLRMDAGLTVQLGRWSGALPGSVLLVLALGGDTGRYPYEGRFYPLEGARLRVWPTRRTYLQLDVFGSPAAVGPELRTREVRVELSSGYSFFTFGLQSSWIFGTGGQPTNDYLHQQLGLFVGVGVM